MLDRYLLSKLISKLLSFAIFIDFFYAFMAYNSKNFLCLFSFLLCTNDNIRRFIDMISFGCVLVVVVVLQHLFYSYDAQTKIRKKVWSHWQKSFRKSFFYKNCQLHRSNLLDFQGEQEFRIQDVPHKFNSSG